jgi:glyoxylase-like metal-dependent hydrolase (beta-lactamase superfamily II)
LDVPLWCSEGDADAVETPELIRDRMPKFWLNQHVSWRFGGPGHPVSLRLREGDEVGGFTVLETPGHTRGHLSYWRAADRVLVLGDVLANLNYLTGWPMLREPPRFFSADPALNRRSARRLADLEPVLICFGHGPPLRDTRRFVEFVHGLPEP